MLIDLNISNNSSNLNRMRSVNQKNSLRMDSRNVFNSDRTNLNPLGQDKFEFRNVNTNKNNLHYLSFGSNAYNQDFSVAAMAPLKVNNDIEMAKFNNDLKYAKNNGVKAISVDVWWGLAEKEGEGKFDWSYYEKIFKAIKDKDLKIIPILSTHQCGGNVGDDVNIPIPKWSWTYLGEKLGMDTKNTHSDELIEKLSYKNERGQHISEVIPVWYDDIMMPKYRAFAHEFKNHFIKNGNSQVNIQDSIEEINVSCGPAGELRYPTYGISGSEFPTRGSFVGYGDGGKNVFRKYLKEKYGNIYELNRAWNIDLKSFDEVLPPSNNPEYEGRAKYFVEAKDYANIQYGRDFIGCQNKVLLKHGEDSLTEMHEEFKDTDVAIGIKRPGIHWQVSNPDTPRIAEITAGQLDYDISKENGHGYNGFFDMIKSVDDKYKNPTITHFTCLEMDNDLNGVYNGQKTNSAAKDVVDWVLKAAKDRGLIIKGENAIEGNLHGEGAWNVLKENIWKGFDGITFLRVGALNNNDFFKNFMTWVNGDLARKAKVAIREVVFRKVA